MTRARGVRLLERLLICGAAALYLVALYAGHRTRAYNADDVAVQGIVDSVLAGNRLDAVVGIDNFVIKVPLYLLASLVPNSRQQLFAVVVVCNLILFTGCVAYLRRLVRPELGSRARCLLAYLPLLAFCALTLAPIDRFDPAAGLEQRYGSYLNPNLRNAEVGIMLLALLAASRWYADARLTRVRALGLGAAALAAGVFYFSDPLFAYTLGGTILVSALMLWLRRESTAAIPLVTLGFTIVSLAVLKGCGVLARAMGWQPTSNIEDRFIPIERLPTNLANTFRAPFDLYRADLFGGSLSAGSTKVFVINSVLVLLGFAALVAAAARLRHRQPLPELLVVVFVAISAAVLTVSMSGAITISSRYLFPAAVAMIPLMARTLVGWHARRRTRRLAQLAGAALVPIVAVNLVLGVVAIARSYAAGAPQPSDALTAAVRAEGMTKGYANFWSANPISYLSQRQVIALPVSCNGPGGAPSQYEWLVNNPDFDIAAQRTFYVYDSRTDPGCRPQDRFGPAYRIIEVGQRYRIYLYDRDVGVDLPRYRPRPG